MESESRPRPVTQAGPSPRTSRAVHTQSASAQSRTECQGLDSPRSQAELSASYSSARLGLQVRQAPLTSRPMRAAAAEFQSYSSGSSVRCPPPPLAHLSELGRCGPRRPHRSTRRSVFYTKYGRLGGSELGCCQPLAVRLLTGTPHESAAVCSRLIGLEFPIHPPASPWCRAPAASDLSATIGWRANTSVPLHIGSHTG